MNKQDFIVKIINSFPSSFKDRNSAEVYEEYDIGLSNNIDFDKLYKLFAVNYDKAIAPRPAYFKQFNNDCTITPDLWNMTEERRSALVKVANWLNSPEYEKCLYSKTKAPYDIRELFRKFQFSNYELDQARMSTKLGP